jgi:hypothetical protein
MCGQTVTFPAIPPARSGPSYQLKNAQAKAKPARNWAAKVPGALGVLRDFQHWDVVGQCVVPFLIIAVLLGGAIFVKNKLGAPASAADAAPAVQADPEALQRMTNLIKAEQAVQAAMRVLDQANALLDYEQKARQHSEAADPLLRKTAEERLHRVENTVKEARKQFDAAESKYRQLGGTKDYRSQLHRY